MENFSHIRNLDYGEQPSDSNEGETAKTALLSMAKDLYELYISLNDSDDLPEWCHYKIASSKSELKAVADYLTSKIMKHNLDTQGYDLKSRYEASHKTFMSESFFSNIFNKFKNKKNTISSNITQPITRPDLTFQNSPTLNTNQTLPSTQTFSTEKSNNTQSNPAVDLSLKNNKEDQLYEDTANEIVQALVNVRLFSKLILDYKKLQDNSAELKSELFSSSFGDNIRLPADNMKRVFVMLFSFSGYYYVIQKLYDASLRLKESKDETPSVKAMRILAADSAIALNKKYSLLPQIMKMNEKETSEYLMAASVSLSIDSIPALQKLLSRYLKIIIVCGSIIKEILDSMPQKDTMGSDSFFNVAQQNYNYEINSRKNKVNLIKYSQFQKVNYNPYISIISSIKSINDFYNKYYDDNIVNFESVVSVYKKQNKGKRQRNLNMFIENIKEIERDLSLVLIFIDKIIKEYKTLKESKDKLRLFNFSKRLIEELSNIKGFSAKERKAAEYIKRTSNKTKLLLLADLSNYISANNDLVSELSIIKNNMKNILEIITEIKISLES